MRHVRPEVHQVSNAASALSLGIALEELANLEEQHDENRLGKLRLGARQETDAESTDGGHRHQEVLVERVAVSHTIDGLLQRLVAYQQIRHKVYQQQLPCGERQMVLDDDSANEQQCRHNDESQLTA